MGKIDGARPVAEILKKMENKPPKTRWGDWVYDEKYDTLTLYRNADNIIWDDEGDSNWLYYVPLKRLGTSKEKLDWIAQLSEKSWCTDSILANLVRAIHYKVRLRENDWIPPNGGW